MLDDPYGRLTKMNNDAKQLRRATRYMVVEKLIEIATAASRDASTLWDICEDVRRHFNEAPDSDTAKQEFAVIADRMRKRLLPTNWEDMKRQGRTRNVDRQPGGEGVK
jgi:hypothetical protein